MSKTYLKYFLLHIFTILICLTMSAQRDIKKDKTHIADKPLYRDPVFDGAADPSIIWSKEDKKWLMFYTNRRANIGGNGVSWVHGTPIGIAESSDGAHWKYKTNCNIGYTMNDATYWAPEVIYYKGNYHMYLTIVPGIFEDWYHPRYIVHLTSKNLIDWKFESQLKLASERCIDASVFQTPDGNWRMYYNNENDGKSIYYADSNDLYHWTDSGKKVIKDRGEGPKIFRWKGKNWMITDPWKGLAVYSSGDFINWKRQEKNILQIPGMGEDDKVIGGHADVVVNNDRAYIFYFTHPGRIPGNKGIDSFETRRSSIQVAELEYINGEITCNRDNTVKINLKN